MALITITEIFALIIVTLVIGFIFKDMVRLPKKIDILDQYKRKNYFEGLIFASLITAPGIILHELSHKFTAMTLGYAATFQMWWPGLGLAILLKLVHSPLLLIAPGYVSISASAPAPEMALIAFAGPFINLVLWIGSLLLLKFYKFNQKWTLILLITKRINMILFIFNMIPLGPFDGAKVLSGLSQLLT